MRFCETNQIRAKLKTCQALILVGEVSRGCGLAKHSIKCGFISSLIIGLRKNQKMLQNRTPPVCSRLACERENAAIAQRLALSPKTVRNHVSIIFSKLQVAGRAEAIIQARDAGLT
jgi:DNA-binding NarL/FixJ family response regulator